MKISNYEAIGALDIIYKETEIRQERKAEKL